MSVPNLQAVVQAVRASQPWPFRSKAQLCAYSHAVIVALHAANPSFGKLKKIPAQNHCVDPSGEFGAVDVALFLPTGQVVDFISSAGFEPDLTLPEPPNAVTWGIGPEGEYGPDDWFAPGGAQPDPPPVPPSDLEARVAELERLIARKADIVRVEAINARLEAVDDRLIYVDSKAIKVLPDYFGEGSIGWFSRSFTLTSRPKP